MKLYNHLQLSHAKIIIVLANKEVPRYRIGKITGISQGKIRRCLNACAQIIRNKNFK